MNATSDKKDNNTLEASKNNQESKKTTDSEKDIGKTITTQQDQQINPNEENHENKLTPSTQENKKDEEQINKNE